MHGQYIIGFGGWYYKDPIPQQKLTFNRIVYMDITKVQRTINSSTVPYRRVHARSPGVP